MKPAHLLCPLLAIAIPSSGIAVLEYRIAPDPGSKSIRATLTFEATAGRNRVAIPAWCPGFYTLKRYYEGISEVRAFDAEGRPMALRSEDQRTWSFSAPSADRVSISYRVAGSDPGLGFFGANVTDRTAFVNGPSTFLYPAGRTQERCTLRIDVPPAWDVATAMDPSGTREFRAASYDELIDHPIEMGRLIRKPFTVAGLPFEAVFVESGGAAGDLDGTVAELKALSEPAIRMFGGAPFKKYYYLVHLAIGNFSGGLEHRSSTVIATAPSNRVRLGSLAAHEFFHAWNVKQIRPKVLGPFDYSQPVRTRNLWFAEGVTDYYATMHTYQAGVYSEADLLASLADEIETLQSSRTRRLRSLEDVCWNTWESTGFGYDDLSYYNKGLVVGLLFDVAIRDATNGAKSLDDVMRALYEAHRLPKPGFEEDGLRVAINEAAGVDLSELYRRLVRSTEELPYGLLETIGLELIGPGDTMADRGFEVDGDGRVTTAIPAVQAMGLRSGDRFLQIDGRPFQGRVPPAEDGILQAVVVRNSLPLQVALSPVEARSEAFRLRRSPRADERAKRLLEGWLRKP